MTQAKDTLHQALQLETPLREIKNLSWAIIMMADGMDEQQAGAFNDVAGVIYDRVQTLTDQWNKLVDHIREPEGIPTSRPAAVLQLVTPLEA